MIDAGCVLGWMIWLVGFILDAGICVLGWIIWLIGFILIVGIIRDKDNILEGHKKVGSICIILIFTGMFGYMITLIGSSNPQRDIVVTYEKPTIIIKTNDITLVNHISKKGELVVIFNSKDVKYWNSTNIMIKITSGKNFYGKDSDSVHEVVIK